MSQEPGAPPPEAVPPPGAVPSLDDADRAAQQLAETSAARLWAGDAATRGLGITLSGIAPGRATATLTVRPELLNGHGTCHGGYLFLLADTAFAFACNTRGASVVAAGADVAFLSAVREGDELVAEAVERVVRGRSGLYDVTVRVGSETVCEFRGRSRAVTPAPSGDPDPAPGAAPATDRRPPT